MKTIECIIRAKFSRKIIVVKQLCLDSQTSIRKKENLNFKGGIFPPFWDNVRNAAFRDEKHAQLPRTVDQAPGSQDPSQNCE